VDKLSGDLIEYETVDSKHLARLVEEYAVDRVPLDQLGEFSTNGHRE
jgi:cell division protease FtsH